MLSKPSGDSARRVFPWSLGIALGALIFATPLSEMHGDLYFFRHAPHTLRHPYWARWIFSLLGLPSEPLAFVLLSLTSIFALLLANQVFRGRHWMIYSSYAFFWSLFYGQIDGLVIGGLAIAWWALERERPVLLGLGLVLASIKPQMGVALSLAIWWWSPSRWKSLLIPGVVLLASLLDFGFWIPGWFTGLFDVYDLTALTRNLSWWGAIGPWVLLIWPLVVMTLLPRRQKLLALAAATAASMPYFPLPSALLLLCMPLPLWAYLGLQLPFLGIFFGEGVYGWTRLIPILLLLWILAPAWLAAGRRAGAVLRRWSREPGAALSAGRRRRATRGKTSAASPAGAAGFAEYRQRGSITIGESGLQHLPGIDRKGVDNLVHGDQVDDMDAPKVG